MKIAFDMYESGSIKHYETHEFENLYFSDADDDGEYALKVEVPCEHTFECDDCEAYRCGCTTEEEVDNCSCQIPDDDCDSDHWETKYVDDVSNYPLHWVSQDGLVALRYVGLHLPPSSLEIR